jgi:hypothetical protein
MLSDRTHSIELLDLCVIRYEVSGTPVVEQKVLMVEVVG